MADFEGKIIVVINVASQCGFTNQYEDMQKIWEKYQTKGLIMLGIPSYDFGKQEPGSNEEIKNFWINIDKCRMSNGTKLALKFLLVCLQRKSEVAQAEWVDFDITSGWWNIPKEKTKNKLSHRVYLSNTAIALLKKIKELCPKKSRNVLNIFQKFL